MNERIRELAKEAEVSHGGMRVVDIEKLAELIVKECIEICEKQYVGAVGTYAGTHNAAVKRCRDQINDHFKNNLDERD